MTIWQSMSGMLRIRITSADIVQTLDALTEEKRSVYHLDVIDPLTIECIISRSDYHHIFAICKKQGNSVELRSRYGVFWFWKKLTCRPILLTGIVLMIFFVIVLPTRVYFYSVEGNRQIPANKILEAAQDCGIRFGVSRRSVRSEKMKNALLSALPELQWAGINTYGCRGVISVRERQESQAATISSDVTAIVAARDGIILSCTVTRGNPVCCVGQSVKKDQLLISPYVDCGLSIKVVPAEGEILGYTDRQVLAVMPAHDTNVCQTENVTHRYSLIIGKKRINLWKGSGISDATCDRMYMEYYITLPGGFRLPICLAAETIASRSGLSEDVSQTDAQKILQRFAADYISTQMIAGNILSEEATVTRDGDLWVLDGNYVCTELLGRIKAERNGVMHE